ncbi:hypothetical protein AVEN_42264-1, partial [Araneus ventricosus]
IPVTQNLFHHYNVTPKDISCRRFNNAAQREEDKASSRSERVGSLGMWLALPLAQIDQQESADWTRRPVHSSQCG